MKKFAVSAITAPPAANDLMRTGSSHGPYAVVLFVPAPQTRRLLGSALAQAGDAVDGAPDPIDAIRLRIAPVGDLLHHSGGVVVLDPRLAIDGIDDQRQGVFRVVEITDYGSGHTCPRSLAAWMNEVPPSLRKIGLSKLEKRRCPAVQRFCSVFQQILKLVSRTEFEQLVQEHGSDRNAKGFDSWSQFVAMTFCQLGRAQSLREIEQGLASAEGRLQQLGVTEAPKRSTLAYANAPRPWQLYESVSYQLFSRCQAVAPGHRFRFKSKLLSLDSTTIDLCAEVFDWAKFRRTKGAVKLHLLLDHDGHLPRYAVITDGKGSDKFVPWRRGNSCSIKSRIRPDD